MTSETDNKVEAAVERARALLRGDFGAWDDDYVLDVLKGVISDRDRLAGEVVALSQVAVGPLSYTAMRAAKEAAEAKLSALVEALERISEIAGTRGILGFNIEGRLDHCRDIASLTLASLDREELATQVVLGLVDRVLEGAIRRSRILRTETVSLWVDDAKAILTILRSKDERAAAFQSRKEETWP